MCGDFDYGERLCEKALAFAREIDHRPTLGLVELDYGCMLSIKGDGERGVSHLQKAIKYWEESQILVFLGMAWVWLGWAYLLMGQTRTAVELTEKGLKTHIDLGIPFFRSGLHSNCGGAYFMLGDLDQARTQTELALQFALQNNERAIIGLSRLWLGRVIGRIDPTQIEAAEQQILQGISLLEELGIPPTLWYGLYVPGRSLCGVGPA